MSDTIPAPPPSSSEPTSPSPWGAPVVAVYALTIFVICLVIAYYRNSDNFLTILFGVAAANSTAAVQYYLGSSSSSRAKDVTIRQAQNALANSTPINPPIQRTPL